MSAGNSWGREGRHVPAAGRESAESTVRRVSGGWIHRREPSGEHALNLPSRYRRAAVRPGRAGKGG